MLESGIYGEPFFFAPGRILLEYQGLDSFLYAKLPPRRARMFVIPRAIAVFNVVSSETVNHDRYSYYTSKTTSTIP